MKRRIFLRNAALAAGSSLLVNSHAKAQVQAEAARNSRSPLVVDPKPLFELSPHFYMQFMEPLGVTDASVEAAWSYDTDNWRQDFVETTKDLAPDVLRFGGLLSRYYKWREGVGPAEKRPWYRNYVWGGKETHRVGTHEFVDFCRRVDSEPLYCVNFLSDGFQHFAHKPEGNRTGNAREAADWVSYANDPDHRERKAHGHSAAYNIKLWQLGNETNYGIGGFKKDQAIATTIEFAKAMRARDPRLKFIGWGDNQWAADMAEQAGEHIDYVAIHMMQQRPLREKSLLEGFGYQHAPEHAWDELMEMVHERVEKKLLAVEAELDARNLKTPIAITEGHLSLYPHNANPLLTEWLTGVYHARVLNLYQRHGDRVKMCTAADFNGMRWTVSSIMHQVPSGSSYLTPVGAVMRLFKRHTGDHGIRVIKASSNLDVAGSRRGDKVYLHVANMNFRQPEEVTFGVEGMAIKDVRIFAIAPEDPRQEAGYRNPHVFKPEESQLTGTGPLKWVFPARSVSAVELTCQAV